MVPMKRLRQVCLLVCAAACGASAAPAIGVSLVADRAPGPAARHGLKKLKVAFEQKGIACEEAATPERARGSVVVVAGLTPESGVESLRIRFTGGKGKQSLLVTGGDDRGLMYGLLDVADRVGWAQDPKNPLSEVREANEKPAVAERALSMYTMSRSHFESYFFNEDYWARYFDTLARNRFNTFALLFAYEASGYFAPAYPYFYDVEGFPDVRVVGQTRERQQRNLKMLNRVVQLAHERGLGVTIGLWDHIYRGGVQGPKELAEKPTPGLVWGLNEKNLTAYIGAALEKFFREVPGVEALQFRMHGESGLRASEMKQFWEALYQVMKRSGGKTRFDFRVKDFPDELIYRAVELGLDFRLTTKYWEEQMGLPFHPTHIDRQNQFDRRHSYADLLRYPQKYKMHWRLWNGGTARILLWGAPDYVRRFAQSTHLYDGDGFEVNEPLATKMAGHPHDMPTFQLLNAPYRYYDYEFERYWHFFQLFGRLGYNPDTPSEVWGREFQARFGKQSGPLVERALHRASWILPRIVASSFPYSKFPTTRGWAEKQRMDDLPVYAKMEPSDTQQFQSPDEAAAGILSGAESAKIAPARNSAWFARAAADVLALADEAEKRAGVNRGQELVSTLVDLRILANLALYHSHRIPAGLGMALFNRSKDVNALDDAIAHERRATQAWEAIVRAAGDVYADDLRMGVPFAALNGHWRDELAALNRGLAALEKQRAGLPPGDRPTARTALGGDTQPPAVRHRALVGAPAGQPLRISAEVEDPSGVKWVRLRYRAVNQHQDYSTLEMLPTGPGNRYQAEVPAAGIDPKYDFMYLIEVMDKAGNGGIYPDLEVETPYVVVKLAR
jgi:hypothetical protein